MKVRRYIHLVTAVLLVLVLCTELYFLRVTSNWYLKKNLIIQKSHTDIKLLGKLSFRVPQVHGKLKRSQIVQPSCETVIATILCEESAEYAESRKHVVAKDFTRQVAQLVVLLKSIAISLKYTSKYQNQHVLQKDDECVKVLLISDTREHYDSLLETIYEKEQWSIEFMKYLKFVHYPVSYPSGTTWMKSMFRPCATLRLFLPEILPSTYERVIYLDTDIIFLRSIKDLWAEFDQFRENETIAAMSACLFHYGTKANNVPYYGKTGLNAGIMLMDLKAMRNSLWSHKLKTVTKIYQHKIKLADQDILNIYFHFFPEQIREFSCEWNFRPWNCRSSSRCYEVSLKRSLSAIHGNALSFTKEGPEPWFYTIFQQFQLTKLNLEFSVTNHILDLRQSLQNVTAASRVSNCFKQTELSEILLNSLERRLVT